MSGRRHVDFSIDDDPDNAVITVEHWDANALGYQRTEMRIEYRDRYATVFMNDEDVTRLIHALLRLDIPPKE